jgi:putative ABC transport system substrate-binding protein
VVATGAIGRAQAQQKTVYRIAVVSPSDPVQNLTETGNYRYRSFFQRLSELGYAEGKNLLVDRYSGEGRTEQFADFAREIVNSNPDLIFVPAFRFAREVRAAKDTLPVVVVGGDPVAFGIANSLARPGGSITGVTVDAGMEMSGKSLELLREMVPTTSRVVFLASRSMWESGYGAINREAAERLKITLLGPPLDAPFQEREYRRLFAAIADERADALYVSGQPENYTNRRLIVQLAEESRLPAIYQYRYFTEIGGLMAYGPDLGDLFRHAADQVVQILKGINPAEIPFYQPTKYDLTVNLRTAKALGLSIPQSIIARADMVIE